MAEFVITVVIKDKQTKAEIEIHPNKKVFNIS